MGGLAILRTASRANCRILTFHSFRKQDQRNLDLLCREMTRSFSPLPLSEIVEGLSRGKLPPNSLTVTVDDGYRSYLEFGHEIFQRHKIPVTVYAVSGFADGRLWLWPDQVEFALQHSELTSLESQITPGVLCSLRLSDQASRLASTSKLTEELKLVEDEVREAYLARLPAMFGVAIPPTPPPDRAAMSWNELRAVASDGVEIGCHTDTHPILSRVTSSSKLEQEIAGSKAILEANLGRPVRHFCYPNGRLMDISPQSANLVRNAGFDSAMTTVPGLNAPGTDIQNLKRISFDSYTDRHYGAELLAGLHL